MGSRDAEAGKDAVVTPMQEQSNSKRRNQVIAGSTTGSLLGSVLLPFIVSPPESIAVPFLVGFGLLGGLPTAYVLNRVAAQSERTNPAPRNWALRAFFISFVIVGLFATCFGRTIIKAR
jgi:hypothetical protein